MGLELIDTVFAPDVLTRPVDVVGHTASEHDCRTEVRDRTGTCRLVVVHNSDRACWVFDPMTAGPMSFLYIIRFCPYCGMELA